MNYLNVHTSVSFKLQVLDFGNILCMNVHHGFHFCRHVAEEYFCSKILSTTNSDFIMSSLSRFQPVTINKSVWIHP